MACMKAVRAKGQLGDLSRGWLAASVLLAIILRTTEPKIDTKFFTVQCTGQYASR
jgi:hypothetical protein